ncbi:MAG: 4Fe-4S dicluster domain-containing protein [Eggerthella lenta]
MIWVPWVCSIVACAWIAGGFTTVDPLYGIPGGVSEQPFGIAYYFGIVALFFVPNLLWGVAPCATASAGWRFMVLGEKLGSALRVPQLRIEADPNGCIGCGKCDRACPMSLPVQDLLAGGAVADAECIQCAACADVCPKGVLRLRMGRMR